MELKNEGEERGSLLRTDHRKEILAVMNFSLPENAYPLAWQPMSKLLYFLQMDRADT
jgi:hypothetical protein